MNEHQLQPRRVSFSQYINSPTGQTLVGNAIKSQPKREAFVTAIISAVANNPGLQECTAPSIISSALQGVALGLAPSPQLGQFYMVPFKNKKTGTTEATFVPGYKGYVQLAIRSGQYIDIDARPIKDGEFKGYDSFSGQPIFSFIADFEEREKRKVIGYQAYFILRSGFKKVLYWPKEKMISHADRYSPAFSKDAKGGRYPKVSFADYEAGNYPPGDEWKYSSFWYKEFDTMACKTMLRQLITKWGPVSIENAEMQAAIAQDFKADEYGESGELIDGAMFAPENPPEAEAEPDENTDTTLQEPGGEPQTQMGLDSL